MNDQQLIELATQVAQGSLAPEQFRRRLNSEGIGREFHVDLDRQVRCGFSEVIFAEGKSRSALIGIARTLVNADQPILATRVTPEQAGWLKSVFPDGRHNATARTWRLDSSHRCDSGQRGKVAVVTAGSSDMPIAEESMETLDWMGVHVAMIADVGVAGPHRLHSRLDELAGVDAIVVVAGMEGALPSVVGGHTNVPVIAVPTSVGYGASLNGIAALLAMLNSCAANVVVVNIDAGFKGGYVAGMIARQVHRNSSATSHTSTEQLDSHEPHS